MIKYILYSYFIVFCLSNTYVLHGVSFLYYLKHSYMFFLGFFGFWGVVLSDKVIKDKAVVLFTMLLLAFFVFLFSMNVVLTFQLIVFAFAVYELSRRLCYRALTSNDVCILLFVATMPMAFDVLFNSASFIYNTYYGRPRLLLGYFHPKEAGNVFAIIFLIYYFLVEKKQNLVWLFFPLTLFILFMIDSRNSLLFVLISVLFSQLINLFGVALPLFVYFIFFIFVPVFLCVLYYDVANVIMSLRLEVWSEALSKGNGFWGGWNDVSYTVQHDDNFYVTLFSSSGIVPVTFVTLIFFLLCNLLGKTKLSTSSPPALGLVFALFFQSFFDAGLFSTGNILNVFSWVMIFMALSVKYYSVRRG